jgi:hypothetical protein
MIVELEYATGALSNNNVGTTGKNCFCPCFSQFIGKIRIFKTGNTATTATGTGVWQFL